MSGACLLCKNVVITLALMVPGPYVKVWESSVSEGGSGMLIGAERVSNRYVCNGS